MGSVEHEEIYQKPNYGFSNLDWTDGARTGLLLFGVGAFFIVRDFYDPVLLDSSVDWLISLTLVFGGWVMFQLARSLSRWKSIKISLSEARSSRTTLQWRSITQGFREIFLYLSVSLVSLSILIWSIRTNSFIDWTEVELFSSAAGSTQSRQSALVLSMLVLAFAPILIGSTLKARHEAKGNLFRDDAVSSTTAYVGILLVSSMGVLAVWAGNQDSEISSTLAFYVTFGVMLMFVTFILWPHIARLLNVHSERLDASDGKPASAGVPQSLPASALSYVDSFLVRLIAPLSGATQKGPMVPHALVLLVLGPLIAIGFFLPAPFGLMPVFLGMLIVLSLGRRWAWIEDDRETASRLLQTESEEIHIGFDNDLKDEALLGYATLFLFVPLALFQIHGWIPSLFVPAEGYANDPVRDWVGFFGSELAKAVPFVDWWEIYQIDIDRPFQPASDLPLGKHLTFLARAMVDLVIMAALFQALSIWQRGRTQNRLYRSGQLDAFDPFTEREFFDRGMIKINGVYKPKERFEEEVEAHKEARSRLGLSPSPYNERRLTEILSGGAYSPEQVEVLAGAKWMIETYDVLAGSSSQKLSQLLAQWQKELYKLGPETADFDSDEMLDWRRQEKLRLEALLTEIRDPDHETIPKTLELEDIQRLVQLAQICGRSIEFRYARALILEILGENPLEASFWALAAQMGKTNSVFSTLAAHKARIEELFPSLGVGAGGFQVRIRQQDMRECAVVAIAEHVTTIESDAQVAVVRNFLKQIVEQNLEADQPTRAIEKLLEHL